MRILLADKNAVVANKLTLYFKVKGALVHWVRTSGEAIYQLSRYTYDVLILDMLSDIDGLQFLKQVRSRDHHVPILFLKDKDELSNTVPLLDGALDDFVTKPLVMKELEARLKLMTNRSHSKAEKDSHAGVCQFDSASQAFSVNGEPVYLSAIEAKILALFLLNDQRILNKQQLKQKLYSWDAQVSTNAIEVYICRLRKKIAPHGFYLKMIRRLGYLLENTADYKIIIADQPEPEERPSHLQPNSIEAG